MVIMSSPVHIARQEILMVGCARNPYLIPILIPTMLGLWTMGCHQGMRTAAIGEGYWPPAVLTFSDEVYSETMLALRAPSTTKCDMCQVSFCGINVQGRCNAAPLLAQQPHGLLDIGDLIECPYVYDCFDSNTVEVEIMLDYLTAQRLAPKHIYREVRLVVFRRHASHIRLQIVAHIQSQPRGFQPLIEANIFSDIHGVAAGMDPNPDSPRTRICRLCAAEVFLWGLKEWWIRERQKGFLEPNITSRKDCPDGSTCVHQKDLGM